MTSTEEQVYAAIAGVAEAPREAITPATQLIGDGRLFDSMKLVELCLVLEDLGAGLGFEFDWTSENAMSRSASMFRTAGSLVAEFCAQQAGRA